MLPLAMMVIGAATISVPGSPAASREQIRTVVVAKHGPHTKIDSILLDQSYALVHGNGFHDGLRQKDGKWVVVCDVYGGEIAPATLQSRCGFPMHIATVMSAEAPVNIAAASGDFTTAAADEKKAYMSASGPESDSERARMQYLNTLNTQMQNGQISRSQAITQWNSARFSWSLP